MLKKLYYERIIYKEVTDVHLGNELDKHGV